MQRVNMVIFLGRYLVYNFQEFWAFYANIRGYSYFRNMGVVSQLRICRPPLPPIRSCYLDIWDAQCAKKMVGVKFYISSRLVAEGVQKGHFGGPNIQFWGPKYSTFYKSGQMCMADWNWSDAHFLQKGFFLCDF